MPAHRALGLSQAGQSEQFLDERSNLVWSDSRIEALDYVAIAIDEELGEVPLDVATIATLAIDLGGEPEHAVHQHVARTTARGLLLLEVLEERRGIVTIDIDLLETRESGIVLGIAELGDALVILLGLLHELIAGEIEHNETLILILAVHRLERLILWGQTAGCSCIDYEQHLALVIAERNLYILLILALPYFDVMYIHNDSTGLTGRGAFLPLEPNLSPTRVYIS